MKKFFQENFTNSEYSNMPENSRSSEYSDDREFSKSSEYFDGSKIDKIYSEYFDDSENSDSSEISRSQLFREFFTNPAVWVSILFQIKNEFRCRKVTIRYALESLKFFFFVERKM